MIGVYGPPGLLLIAVAWAMAAGGGTGGAALALTCSLLAISVLLASRGGLAAPRTPVLVLATLGLLIAWLIGAGVLRVGLSLTSVRIPILILIAFLSVQVVRLLDQEQRGRLMQGLIVLGSVHATIAIAEALMQVASEMVVVPPRVDGLIGNANALGIFLVASATLTVRELTLRRAPLLGVPLALQGSALLLTGSRLAIIVALCVAAWFLPIRGARRTWIFLAPWAITATAIVAVRFWNAEPERLNLTVAAVKRIAERPLAGRGPTPIVYDIPAGEALPTTHAHNEFLQLAVEYGLVGLALTIAVLIFAFRSRPRAVRRDAWVVAAAVSLVASGLTDFSLRITGITVTAAVLTAAALIPPPTHGARLGAATSEGSQVVG